MKALYYKVFFLFISSQKPSVFEHSRNIRSFLFSEGKLLQRQVTQALLVIIIENHEDVRS